jgi:hypothetical protein
LSDLFFKVVELGGENMLCNADGGPGGTGSTMDAATNSTALPDALADGILEPGERFRVNFHIGLSSLRAFIFYVDLFGISE